MKKIFKILILGITLACSIVPLISFAGSIDLTDVDIKGYSNQLNGANGTGDDLSSTIESVGLRVLTYAKYIFQGILLIIIVYAGAQMITSMGSDEEQLSTSKRILWYSIIGIFFINMPGTIYNAIRGNRPDVKGGVGSSWGNDISSSVQNLFINTDVFVATINNTFIRFLKIGLVGIAIAVIILSGIKILTSRGREDQITEGKNKILWSVIGLIFIGFIDVWQRFVYTGNIGDGKDIFETVANLALFLAAPTVVFFLCLAGYYYIIAAGDEEKTKKGKNIIINVVIATAILLVSCVFLYDLINL